MPDAVVHEGLYGWLFLVGGSNDVAAQYRRPSSFTPYLAERWIQLLVQRRERAEAAGASYHHILVPEKLSVYDELVGPGLPVDIELAPSQSLPRAIRRHPMSRVLEDVWAEVTGPLRAVRARTQVFWRTDSHWTPEGAYAAYEQVCLRLGIAPRRDLLNRPADEADLVLDLAAHTQRSDTERFRMRNHVTDASRVFANRVVELKESTGRVNDAGLHVGSRVTFRNASSVAAPLRVLLFGDSFSEYRPTLLTGLLAETVAELDFVWSASVDWRLVEETRPDALVTELAERFHVVPPVDDGFSLVALEDRLLAASRQAG